jgi:N-acyl-L-homoserine lactone synthetase
VAGNIDFGDRAEDRLAIGPFHIVYARGTDPRIDEYHLRYRAFVEEHHWESPGDSDDAVERDEFDAFCCSTLVVHTATQEAAGCQRLILPESLPHDHLTNVEREYRPLAAAPRVDFTTMPRHAWAEASRLAIAPPYRWGSSATALPAIVAITYASLALAVALNRTSVFTISDPRTARLTRRMGFAMYQVGQPVEFHGRRAIFRIDVADVVASIPTDVRWTVVRLIQAARLVAGQPAACGTSSQAA